MERCTRERNSFDGQSREALLEENERLRSELQKLEDAIRAAASRRKGLGRFTARVGLRVLAGSQLFQKTVDLWNAWSGWLRTRGTAPWPELSTRDFAAALLARFSRIGIVFLLLAALPFVVTLVQLLVLVRQNELIDQQSQLAESARRSALVFEQTAILDEIDEELDALPPDPAPGDSIRPRLSQRLEGRISALSKSLRPYRYLEGDQLILRPQSPERGQLLLALVSSEVDLAWILSNGDLSYSDLPGTRIGDFDFDISSRGHSRGRFPFVPNFDGSNFQGAWLTRGSFQEASLEGVNFRNTVLLLVDFRSANLEGADFEDAALSWVDFRDAKLKNANFKGAYIQSPKFSEQSAADAGLLAARLCQAGWITAMGNEIPSRLLIEMRKNKACIGKMAIMDQDSL